MQFFLFFSSLLMLCLSRSAHAIANLTFYQMILMPEAPITRVLVHLLPLILNKNLLTPHSTKAPSESPPTTQTPQGPPGLQSLWPPSSQNAMPSSKTCSQVIAADRKSGISYLIIAVRKFSLLSSFQFSKPVNWWRGEITGQLWSSSNSPEYEVFHIQSLL